jgi:transposase InsO family protein
MDELSAIPEASREIALERFELLRPYLEGARPLRTVALEASIPYRTAVRWASGYRKDGLAALARKSRTDQGGRRLASATLIKAIEGLALERPPLPMSSIHRQVSAMAETLNESKPSYAVVRRIVHSLPAGLMMLAHRGNKAYSEGFDLVHRREALRPNSIWQVDHAQLDIKLLREDGSIGRPWLTIVIDDYSRAVAGYYLGFDPPSSLRTTLALRRGIWRKGDPHWEICGIPDILYTDNGSDFRSKHLEQLAADLKIRLVFSTPGQPQGRGRIERFFRTVNEMFLCDLDGYPLPLKPAYYDVLHEYEARIESIPDPTTLIVVDEADRLTMNSLEQLRSIFDQNGLGMVLIGMPGIEKRIARYPQFFSRIGFVHEFRALSDADIQVLLEQRWAPVGIHLPAPSPAPEVITAVIRLTRGNFRLLVRLLTQMERVLAINGLETLSVDVVETARENLVIGQA